MTMEENQDDIMLQYGADPALLQFFGVDQEGEVICKIRDHGSDLVRRIRLSSLIAHLRDQDIASPPLLLRFHGIIRTTMERLQQAFEEAIARYRYSARFQYIYPVKVCHGRSVLQQIMDIGSSFAIGLEAGSRCEFMLCASLPEAANATIIFNGHKDCDDFGMVRIAEQRGLSPVLVFEDLDQLQLLVQYATRTGWLPEIAFRLRLQVVGSGRWSESSGPTSKFGLDAAEISTARGILSKGNMLAALTTIQYHLGSQVSQVKRIAEGAKEAITIFIELRNHGATNLQNIDCGGGLINRLNRSRFHGDGLGDYTLSEYANALVGTIASACDDARITHPSILLESGRALLSSHAVLVTERVADRDDFTYCNMSLFRSLLDFRLEPRAFPSVPLGGLTSLNKRDVRIADLTGDSDGILDYFPRGRTKVSMPDDASTAARYIAFFDVGAYQEALGTAHNLFGPVDEVDIPGDVDCSDYIKLTRRPGACVSSMLEQQGCTLPPWMRPFGNLSTYPRRQMPLA